MLIIGLIGYAEYQSHYDWVKARLDDPVDSHTYGCTGGGLAGYYLCKLTLPTPDSMIIIQIALGATLTIIGTIIGVRDHGRYERKHLAIVENSKTDGSPFK